MNKKMKRKILIPILNKSFTGLSIPILYLSDNVVIEKITDEETGAIFLQTNSDIRSLLTSKTKCIKLLNLSSQDCNIFLQEQATIISFLMNFFRKEAPISLMHALLFIKKRKLRIKEILDLESSSDALFLRKTRYKFDDKISKKTLIHFYQVLNKAIAQNANLLLTLNRYNNGLIRTSVFDRIVDITISLESLIDGTAELNYKFALYNSWACENDKKKRQKSFDLLKKLYEVRSKIVHGTALSSKSYKKHIKPIEDNWDEVLRIAKHSIAYYVLYLFKKESKSWSSHQKKLALGLEDKITQEVEDN